MSDIVEAVDERAAIERLQAVAERLAGESAEYTWHDVASLPNLVVASIAPRDPRACAISLIGQGWLTIQLGSSGARWELDYSDDGLRFAAELIEAAIAGRVVEVTAFGRSRLTVTFSNGDHEWTTTYFGCGAFLVPLPGWRRWGRSHTFAPYVDAGPRGPARHEPHGSHR